MKKIILPFLFLFLGFGAYAGNENADRIYNYLEENHDAISLSLSKKMIDFFDLDLDLNGKERWITGDFSKGRMLVISEKVTAAKTNELFTQEGFKLIDFEEEDQDDDSQVWLYVKRKGKNVAEAHFVVEEEESLILLSVYGDMKISDKK
ncbi:MAG: DUF4252 domain-containing protein [Vicingaceae bacterium]